MMTSIKDLVRTNIKVSALDQDGAVVSEDFFTNEIVKEGASVISRLLVDPSGPRPSHIYARWGSDLSEANGTTNFATSTSDVTYNDFADTTGDVGALREPIFSAAKLEPNDTIVDGKITFFFRLTATSDLIGSFDASTSRIFYLGLAAAKDLSDPSQDLIVSLLSTAGEDPFPGLEIPTNGQLAIDYKMSFAI